MKTVVICGSDRFAKDIQEFAKKLVKLGVVVYAPNSYRASGGDWSRVHEYDKKFVALGLTLEHVYKIRMADVVYVYNKDGYAGVSTTLEIGCAMALDKPIYVFSDKDPEICRRSLFRGFVKDPKELIKFLK